MAFKYGSNLVLALIIHHNPTMQDRLMEFNIYILLTYQLMSCMLSIPYQQLFSSSHITNIIIHMANQKINSPTNQLQYYLIPTFPTNIFTKTTN